VTNEEIVNGRARRYYELTPGGRADVGSRRTPREVWHSALRMAVLMLLAYAAGALTSGGGGCC
jgi:DNA-binding PadR family transcriptional regulator